MQKFFGGKRSIERYLISGRYTYLSYKIGWMERKREKMSPHLTFMTVDNNLFSCPMDFTVFLHLVQVDWTLLTGLDAG